MAKRTIPLIVALLGAVLLSACGGRSGAIEGSAPASEAISAAFADPQGTFADPEATGEDLVNAWFGLLALTGRGAGEVATDAAEVEAGMAIVRPYLDPAFTLMRATGQRYTAGDYVPLDIDAFELSDFVVTEPREDIRVIRYFVSQPGATAPDAGVVMSGEKAPRISVLRWDAELGHWVMVSYANFNSAIGAICGQEPISVSGETPVTSPEDLALGTSLVRKWRDITTGVLKEKFMHPASQIQLADGQGWPTADGTPIEWAPAQDYDFAHVGVARDGDLIVASFDAVVRDLVMEGEEYRETASPRLLTFLRNPQGAWEVIALANFNVPQDVPADVECISLTQ